ncbi:hypothetical protein DPMN_134861 [Dreissena polymorpha]|uniref:Uncharacterized protein n=1 Tax=Dreissena polymorpha TaxID=45954 RepID=A0A9D4JF95_DREPO|nr:hypothetical protein DPMN_134861 [Dreissena polymorpha]
MNASQIARVYSAELAPIPWDHTPASVSKVELGLTVRKISTSASRTRVSTGAPALTLRALTSARVPRDWEALTVNTTLMNASQITGVYSAELAPILWDHTPASVSKVEPGPTVRKISTSASRTLASTGAPALTLRVRISVHVPRDGVARTVNTTLMNASQITRVYSAELAPIPWDHTPASVSKVELGPTVRKTLMNASQITGVYSAELAPIPWDHTPASVSKVELGPTVRKISTSAPVTRVSTGAPALTLRARISVHVPRDGVARTVNTISTSASRTRVSTGAPVLTLRARISVNVPRDGVARTVNTTIMNVR